MLRLASPVIVVGARTALSARAQPAGSLASTFTGERLTDKDSSREEIDLDL